MTKENLQYIVSVLKGETPKNCPDWWEMLGFLQCHKIAGMWYRKATQLQLPLPDKIQRILQNIFDSQARRVRHMRGYIEELSDSLCQTCVGHAFLKGSALCNVRLNGKEIYTDGERVSNDIDILVAPDTLDAIGATLKALGYMQGRYDRTTDTVIPFARTEILRRRMNRGEVAPFVKRTGNAEFPFAEIDVNFSLGNTPNDGAELLREMVRTAKAYDGKIKMNTLSPETFFLHLVMHRRSGFCALRVGEWRSFIRKRKKRRKRSARKTPCWIKYISMCDCGSCKKRKAKRQTKANLTTHCAKNCKRCFVRRKKRRRR